MIAPTISLRSLLRDDQTTLAGASTVDLPQYVDEVLRPARARTTQLDSYLAGMVERELQENGVNVRRPTDLRHWLSAYGAAAATDSAYSTMLDAATPGEDDKPARQTVANATVGHLRNRDTTREIDIIVEGEDRNWPGPPATGASGT